MFKVGQKVRIKTLSECINEHVSNFNEDEMNEFCGKLATITGLSARKPGDFLLDISFDRQVNQGEGWHWNPNLLKPININLDIE